MAIVFSNGGAGWSNVVGGPVQSTDTVVNPPFVAFKNYPLYSNAPVVLAITASTDSGTNSGGEPLYDYEAQASTDQNFTSSVVSVKGSGSTVSFGILPKAQYYFRARYTV